MAENIVLSKDNNPEALEIVNVLAIEDRRSCATTAELLIIQAGQARAERIKDLNNAKKE